MLRTVDISEYWRNIIKENEEFKNIAKAENPEFYLMWLAMQRVFYNQFINTVDDYGLKKWEKFLKVTPFATDTIEDRRNRIKALLLGDLPYTMRSLILKLETICNSKDVQVYYIKPDFLLEIKIPYESKNQRTSIKLLLKRIVPANLRFNLIQKITPIENTFNIRSNLGGSTFVKMPLGIKGGYEIVTVRANLGGYKYTEISAGEIREV